MYDIIELQHELSEAQGKLPSQNKIRQRTAAVEDASRLLRSGYTPCEVSAFLGPNVISFSDIKSEQSKIEEDNQNRRKFLASGRLELPGEMAHFTIYQR